MVLIKRLMVRGVRGIQVDNMYRRVISTLFIKKNTALLVEGDGSRFRNNMMILKISSGFSI